MSCSILNENMRPPASPAVRPGRWWKARETLKREPAGQWKWSWLAINGQEMMSPPVKARHPDDSPPMSSKSGTKIWKCLRIRCKCDFGSHSSSDSNPVQEALSVSRYWSQCQIAKKKKKINYLCCCFTPFRQWVRLTWTETIWTLPQL